MPSIFWTAFNTLILSCLVAAAPHKRNCNISNCAYSSSDSPKCWGNYSAATNYYDEVPETGVTREYWFDIQNGTAAVDGVERMVLTVNGAFPGPTIFADWGDWVVVHVSNSLQNNGTSIHWHGLRQLLTTQEDGVASITQCPLAPGDTMTYKWRAAQYGHSWYHSHFSLQAWNGVLGGIVVNGPATAPFDEDKGVLLLGDWFHDTTDVLWSTIADTGVPPPAQNGLINGTNIYGDGGSRFETSFAKGKRHRIRLVNTAIDTHYKFMIDNHTMTVIATDFVPIQPYTTDVLSIGIGQRYDVIVEADQEVGDFWLRAYPDTACSAVNEMETDIKGVIRYDATSTLDPASTPYGYTNDCADEDPSNLVPFVAIDIAGPDTLETFDLDFNATTGLWKWTLNGNTFLSDWSVPSKLTCVLV
jgi:FtsP/CotA-like multicopper oxidase with cupredoxin domain